MYRPLDADAREIRLLTVHPPRPESGILKGIISAWRPGVLECTTSHISLNGPHPSYETISYVWGDPKPCRKIRIDGEVKQIPRNADMALRTLALPDEPRVLWIDTICINQANPQERASQVVLMGQIYCSTVQNLIYLGPESKQTANVDRMLGNFESAIEAQLGGESLAFQLLERHMRIDSILPRIMRVEAPAQEPTSSWIGHFHRVVHDKSFLTFPADGKSLPEGGLLESMYSKRDGLTSLIVQNPWFRRAWTLQEAVLPKTSLCFLGNQKFPLDWLLKVVAWLSLVRGDYLAFQLRFSKGIRSIVTLFKLRHEFKKERHVDLSRLMKISNQRRASDIRDMVFGTLGLCQRNVDSLPCLLAPDYTKPIEHVLRDATKAALLSQPNGMKVLYEVHNGEDPREPDRYLSLDFVDPLYNKLRNLPSWTPDWFRLSEDGSPPSTLPDPISWSFWSGWQRLPYIPAEDVDLDTAKAVFDDRPDTLLLRGSIMGRVRDVSEVFDFHVQSSYRLCQAFLGGLGAVPSVRAEAAAIDDTTRSASADCFLAAMNWSQPLYGSGAFGPASEDDSADVWFHSVARSLIADTTVQGTKSTRKYCDAFAKVAESALGGEGEAYWEAARRAATDRRLAITDNDLLVLGSRGTTPGDIVVKVRGSVYPFVLREVDGDEHILVEHCYVDGAMFWQDYGTVAHKMPDEEIQTFCLR